MIRLDIHARISETAWENHVQRAYELGYVRSANRAGRPRGFSKYVDMLSRLTYVDARPEYLRGSDQWCTGDPLPQRALRPLTSSLVDLGYVALAHHIWPYRTQQPVVNGFRRTVEPPILRAYGTTRPGEYSVLALVSPVLEAIGLGWLRPTTLFDHAPEDLYKQHPRRRPKIIYVS